MVTLRTAEDLRESAKDVLEAVDAAVSAIAPRPDGSEDPMGDSLSVLGETVELLVVLATDMSEDPAHVTLMQIGTEITSIANFESFRLSSDVPGPVKAAMDDMAVHISILTHEVMETAGVLFGGDAR